MTDKAHKKQINMKGKGWKLIHYEGKVVALIEASDSQQVSFPDWYTGVSFKTEADALAAIKKLGLIYEPQMDR